MRDCSHPRILAQFLLIRTRWTNPGEGKQGLRRQGRCWVHPQGSPILCSGDKPPLRVQHHKAKPSTIPGGQRGSSSDTHTHSRESWHPAGIRKITGNREEQQRRHLSKVSPCALLHFLINKDTLNLFSTYNWLGLCSCQEKKQNQKKPPKKS